MQDHNNTSLESSVEPPVAQTQPDNKFSSDEAPGINESEFFLSYFREVDNIHQHHDDHDIADIINPCRPSSLSNTTVTSQCRQRKVVHHISEIASLPEAAEECWPLNTTTNLERHSVAKINPSLGDEIRQPNVGIKDNLEAKFRNAISHEPSSSDSIVSSLMAAALTATATTTMTTTYKRARDITVLGSNNEDLATCEKNPCHNDNLISTTGTHMEQQPLMMMKYKQYGGSNNCSGSNDMSTAKSGSQTDQNNVVSNNTVRGQSAEAHYNAAASDDDDGRVCSPRLILSSKDDQVMADDKNASLMSPCMKPSNASHVDHASMSPCMKPSNASHGDHASMSPCMKPSNASHDDHLTRMSSCMKASSARHDDHTTSATSNGGILSHEDGDVILVNYRKTVDADDDDKMRTSLLCGDATIFHFNLNATTLHEVI